MNTVKYKEGETLKNMFLKNMGISDTNEINNWWIKGRDNKYIVNGLKEIKDKLLQFKDKGVTICGDYDVDGITSIAILYLISTWIGIKKVSYLIPQRFTEGFGINKRMIDDIDPSNLIITCDNGIAQLDAIKYAKEKGFTVCIIDHHLPVMEGEKPVYPDADVIVDPNAIENSADFNGYCGAGLCYKLGCEFFNDSRRDILTSLAAIGTIGDVMDFHEDNYYIVRKGLPLLLKDETTTKGVRMLLKTLKIEEHITSTDVGFSVCPAINAISRLNDEGACLAVECLISRGSDADAVRNAALLAEWNLKRKDLKKTGIEKAEEIISVENKSNDCPIVLYIPETQEGILGLIASSLVEKYKVPAIVFTNASEKGCLKASGRSCGNYHMKNKLDEAAYSFKNLYNNDLFVVYGGHEGAAGMTIKEENLNLLSKLLNSNTEDYKYEDNEVVVEISTNDINTAANEMKKFEPYGQGNKMPIFMVKDFTLDMNKEGLKKTLLKGDTVKFISNGISALCFGMAKTLEEINNSTSKLTLIGTISDNWWNGRCTRQILVNEVIDRGNA